MGNHFKVHGDHSKGQNLLKRSNFEMLLLLTKNAHKVGEKCRETILRVRETILSGNISQKSQILKCSYFAQNTHKVEQKCWETILRASETI